MDDSVIVSVLSKKKSGHKYIFMIEEGRAFDLGVMCGRWALSDELDFDWDDAFRVMKNYKTALMN